MKIPVSLSCAVGLLCALLSQPRSSTAQQGAACVISTTPAYGNAADMRDLRTRAWQLLLPIARADPPIYNSPDWTQREAAFRQPSGPPEPHRGLTLSFTREFVYARLAKKNAAAPPDPSAPEATLYESVFFNPAAVAHIQDKDFPLYQNNDTAAKLLGESKREIPEFGKDAMAVKTFWRPVPEKTQVKVGVWQWRNLPPGADEFPESAWPRAQICVELDPAPGSPCLKAADKFVTTVTTENTGAGFSCPAASGDCPTLPKGRTLILLATHVASKQKPDWFWATYWWKGIERTDGALPATASWTCDNAQRPAELSTGLWSNYSMNVTTSFTMPKPKVAAADMNTCGSPAMIGNYEQLLAAYNPFVEGVTIRGRKSTCIDCHSRALNASQFPFYIPPVCSGTRYLPKLSDFEGSIRTDYMWSVANHLKPSH